MSNLHKLTSGYLRFVVAGRATNKNALTGNYADYTLCTPHICCGWMDLHNDDGYGVSEYQPYLKLKPLFWDADARLVVCNSDAEFIIIEPTDQAIQFNAMRQHALVPVAVALELVTRQDEEGPLYKLFDELVSNGSYNPKLVWDWLDVVPDVGADEVFIP